MKKYKRNVFKPANNQQDLNMMTLDFKAEIDEKSTQGCKSVLLINCIDL